MSWELAACLQYCGLEERWLKILKDLGITTKIDLVTLVNNDDLSDILVRNANDAEKEALKLLLSNECADHVQGMRELAKHLTENGLDPTKWRKTFADEGIETEEHLHKFSGNLEKYDNLTGEMNPVETFGVQQMMGIAPEVAGEHETKISLDKIGLVSTYWFPIFKNDLKVSHPLLFEFISSLDCQILMRKARHENERSIIRQHFMQGRDDSLFSKRRVQDKEKARKYNIEIQRNLSELQKLLSKRQQIDNCEKMTKEKDGKLLDFNVKFRLQNFRMLLQIQNTEYTVPATCMSQRVEMLTQHQTANLQNVSKADLSDREVMEKASDGLVLRGMCFITDSEERLVVRNKILRSPTKFSLSNPTFPAYRCTEFFTFQKSLDSFLASLKNNGYSFTAAERVLNDTQLDATMIPQNGHTPCDKQSCHSLVKYIFIPTACGYLEKDNLLSSKDALLALKQIESVQDSPKDLLYEKCDHFFSEYGTHVNSGQIHFGGIYLVKLDYSGYLPHDSPEILNSVADDVMQEVMETDFNHIRNDGDYVNSLCETLRKKYDKLDTKKLRVSLQTVGGQPTAHSFSHWKQGLAGDNSSWAVIDRGFCVKGVWELVKHHEDFFENHSVLAGILTAAWEAKSRLKINQLPNHRHLVEVPERLLELSTFVEKIISDPVISKDLERYLDYITCEKDELIFISRNPHLWHSIAKDNPCIPMFLDKVAQTLNKSFRRNNKSLNFLFLQLVEGFESSSFMSKEAICKWIMNNESSSRNQISKCLAVVIHFISVVKKFVIPRLKAACKSKSSQSQVDGHCICITEDLAVFASNVLDKLHGLGERHIAYLLSLSLADLGYNINCRNFDNWLSEENVANFVKNFEERKKRLLKYRTQSVGKVECYLLQVALELGKEYRGGLNTSHRLFGMMQDMKSYFSMEAKQVLEKHDGDPNQLDKIESYVQSILFGTLQDDENHDILGTGLAKVMQVPAASAEYSDISLFQLSVPNRSISEGRSINDSSIIDMLGLVDYFPSKITLQHVMQVPVDKLDTMHDIPWYVLQKLVMLDYRGRNLTTLPSDLKKKKHCEQENQEGKEDDDFVDDIFASIHSLAEAILPLMPHPLDVLAAIFLCSSDFLRQLLAEKMYMCHVSIPLLLPDENGKLTYLLWALRTVICEYELSDNKAIETSIVSCNMPIVSLLRLGKATRSKSSLLNSVISNQGHNTFFHRDCASSVLHPKLSDGLADVAWFLPTKQVKSELTEAVTFINLHGNGTCLPQQCSFLIRSSNVIVILTSIEELATLESIATVKDIIANDTKLVLIVGKTPGTSNENFKQLFASCLKDIGHDLKKQKIILDFNNNGPLNVSEISSEIVNSIAARLGEDNRYTLAECKKFAEEIGINVDENDPMCMSGQVFAKEVFNHIDSNNLASTKVEMLPLQGDLWHQWGVLEKTEHRKEGKVRCSEQYAAELHEQKQALRRKQLQICNNLPRLLESFLSKLLQLEVPMKLYFLKWLIIYLDGDSRQALPSLIKKYSLKWTEISQHKSKQKDAADAYMMALQEDLCKIEEKLAMTSLGLEHLMREVGQAFEAVANLSSQVKHGLRDSIHRLPRIMAELMLFGYPLELMDGDASHVPLSWVTAVLSELKMMIGDKKVFVLSVLGVQSSGKSTLLNTMFGLQFAISAGRCTRGVYAQLVPVPKHESNISYDYILVVDTEGLRAPELGSTKHQHDNELATLVIGLGDMTIINIKGENPTEMQDVLQIVVHAFLRMQLVNKNLKLQSSCFFIHQNVGAVNAAGKMIFGQQKLLDNLDQMTVAAADQENVTGIYCFKEVINFDVEKNVWYFSDLWQGDPPMAPANPGYSKKVCEVKQALLQEMQKRSSSSSLSTICIRINDLWKGILAENFVFSFKNSLELKTYGSLESILTDLSWSLQNDALKWLNNACNKVSSCETALSTLEVNLSCEFATYCKRMYDEAEQKLSSFFEKSDEKDILEQWKERSILKLKDRNDETYKTTLNALKNEFEIRKEELKQIEKTEVYKEEIQNMAKKLAIELQEKENLSEKDLENEFSRMWNKLMESFSTYQHGDRSVDFKGAVYGIMFEMLRPHSALLAEELKKFQDRPLVRNLHDGFCIAQEHLSCKRNWRIWKSTPNAKCFEAAYELIKSVYAEIEEYLDGIQGMNLSSAHAGMVIKIVCDMIERNCHSNMHFKFTALFKVHFVIHVCQYTIFRFNKIHQDHLKETDPKTIVERNYREQLLRLFKNKYTKSKNEKMVADVLCTCLMVAVKKAVLRDMARELANDVRCNVPSLHTKGDLLNSVLRDLLKIKCFEEYHSYLNGIKLYLKKWVKEYTNRYVFKRKENGITRYAELASLQIDTHVQKITQEIANATEQVLHESHGHNFNLWLRKFHVGISEKLPLPQSNLSLVSKETIEDISFFQESMMKNLQSGKMDLVNKAKRVTEFHLQSQKDSVYALLEKECLGCCEQCPFCKAPCSLTISGHDVQHSALQHYPQGAGRYRWDRDKTLIIDNCSGLVCSENMFKNVDTNDQWHPYKDYKAFYPNWKIQGDASMEASLYWKWFMANFAGQLAEAYDAEVPDIPLAWTRITLGEAAASLQ